jgi:hypothetical protein
MIRKISYNSKNIYIYIFNHKNLGENFFSKKEKKIYSNFQPNKHGRTKLSKKKIKNFKKHYFNRVLRHYFKHT